MSDSDVMTEWQRVISSGLSVYGYYPTHADYMRWHNRFVRVGLIQKRAGGWKKSGEKATADRAQYSRTWRANHPGRASEHVQRYWAKRLVAGMV
jgi:hypothetical protein